MLLFHSASYSLTIAPSITKMHVREQQRKTQASSLLGVCVAQRETAMWCCVIQAKGLCVVALTRQFSPNKTPIVEWAPWRSWWVGCGGGCGGGRYKQGEVPSMNQFNEHDGFAKAKL